MRRIREGRTYSDDGADRDYGYEGVYGAGLYDKYPDDRPEIYKNLIETELAPLVEKWVASNLHEKVHLTNCKIIDINRRIGAYGFVEFDIYFRDNPGTNSLYKYNANVTPLKKQIMLWGKNHTNDYDTEKYENCGDIDIGLGANSSGKLTMVEVVISFSDAITLNEGWHYWDDDNDYTNIEIFTSFNGECSPVALKRAERACDVASKWYGDDLVVRIEEDVEGIPVVYMSFPYEADASVVYDILSENGFKCRYYGDPIHIGGQIVYEVYIDDYKR